MKYKYIQTCRKNKLSRATKTTINERNFENLLRIYDVYKRICISIRALFETEMEKVGTSWSGVVI